MSDMINRNDALEIIQSMYPGIPRVPWLRKDWQERYEPYIRAEKAIRGLPSAQPEIVRCKDCKYGEQDEVGRWFCSDLGCQIGIKDGSGFCADAERRTDG